MVRLSLLQGHVVLGLLFVLSFLFLRPLALVPAFRWRNTVSYWCAFALCFLLTSNTIIVIHLGIVCAYLLLFFVLRGSARAQRSRYSLSGHLLLCCEALVIYSGLFYLLAHGGTSRFFYGEHLGMAFLALVSHTVSLGRRCGELRRAGLFSAKVFAVASLVVSLVAGSTVAVGLLKARQYGEQAPAAEKRALTISLLEDTGEASWQGDVSLLTADEACRNCHADIFAQWQISPHRFAVNNRLFRKVRDLFMQDFSPADAVFCDRCHDPVGVVLGQAGGELSLSEGVNCKACHGIKESLGHNGRIVYELEEVYSCATRRVEESRRDYMLLLRMTKARHQAQWKVPEGGWDSGGCLSCHRVRLAGKYTDGREMILGDMFSPWVHASSARRDKGCISCHCLLRRDWPGQRHARPDHVMLGTNQAMDYTRISRIPGDEGLARVREILDHVWFPGKVETVEWYERAYRRMPVDFLGGDMLRDFDFAFDHPVLGVEIRAQPVPETRRLEVEVTTTNLTRAHNIPSGPLDLNEVWLDFAVYDTQGRKIYHSGWIDERHRVEATARRLGAKVLDGEGGAISEHRFWRARGLSDVRILAPDAVVHDRFSVLVPPAAGAEVRLEARWLYRRYNQEITDWLFGGDGTTLPISILGSAHYQVSFP